MINNWRLEEYETLVLKLWLKVYDDNNVLNLEPDLGDEYEKLMFENEVKSWRKEWELLNKDKDLVTKYEEIFKELELIEKKSNRKIMMNRVFKLFSKEKQLSKN